MIIKTDASELGYGGRLEQNFKKQGNQPDKIKTKPILLEKLHYDEMQIPDNRYRNISSVHYN